MKEAPGERITLWRDIVALVYVGDLAAAESPFPICYVQIEGIEGASSIELRSSTYDVKRGYFRRFEHTWRMCGVHLSNHALSPRAASPRRLPRRDRGAVRTELVIKLANGPSKPPLHIVSRSISFRSAAKILESYPFIFPEEEWGVRYGVYAFPSSIRRRLVVQHWFPHPSRAKL